MSSNKNKYIESFDKAGFLAVVDDADSKLHRQVYKYSRFRGAYTLDVVTPKHLADYYNKPMGLYIKIRARAFGIQDKTSNFPKRIIECTRKFINNIESVNMVEKPSSCNSMLLNFQYDKISEMISVIDYLCNGILKDLPELCRVLDAKRIIDTGGITCSHGCIPTKSKKMKAQCYINKDGEDIFWYYCENCKSQYQYFKINEQGQPIYYKHYGLIEFDGIAFVGLY